MNDRHAPRSTAILRVGLDPKLIGCVGLQVVNDGVTGRTGLIVPLLAPLTVAHGVVSEPKTEQNRTYRLLYGYHNLFNYFLRFCIEVQ